MRASLLVVLLGGVMISLGCAGKRGGGEQTGVFSGGDPKLIVTPETALVGSVSRSNPAGRFVVLNFQVGRLPAIDQRFNVYRRGLKVGEVKVTGPQHDDNIVADILAGEAAAGDQVRNN